MTYVPKYIRLPKVHCTEIKELVKSGQYVTEAEIFRQAIREFLERHRPKQRIVHLPS